MVRIFGRFLWRFTIYKNKVKIFLSLCDKNAKNIMARDSEREHIYKTLINVYDMLSEHERVTVKDIQKIRLRKAGKQGFRCNKKTVTFVE